MTEQRRGLYEVLPISGAGARPDAPAERGTVLHAFLGHLADGTPETIPESLIPLLDTTLLTNAPGAPWVGNQLCRSHPVAAEIVLHNIRDAVPSRWSLKVDPLRSLALREPAAREGRGLDNEPAPPQKSLDTPVVRAVRGAERV